MKLVTIARDNGVTGALIADEVLDFGLAQQTLAEVGPIHTDMRVLVGGEGLEVARRLVESIEQGSDGQRQRLRESGALKARPSVKLLAPSPKPAVFFAHGQAYHSHARDWNADAPREKPAHPPVGFLKAQSSIIGPDEAICIPRAAPDHVDFEGEFSVVFGRPCYRVSRHEAMDYIMGYTIVNDVSARDWVLKMIDPENKIGANQLRGLNSMFKSFPTFAPMGPHIVTVDEIADYRDVRLVSRLNGEVFQDAMLGELIWDLPELIEYYSSCTAFKPGDIMTTGTPGGVGAGRKPPVFLKPGDVVSISATSLGELVNPVIAE